MLYTIGKIENLKVETKIENWKIEKVSKIENLKNRKLKIEIGNLKIENWKLKK